MVATKSDLALLAVSAASRARASSRRTIAPFLFQLFPVCGQFLVAIAYIAQHRIEAIDQTSDFPVGGLLDGHVVAMVSPDLVHCAQQPSQWTRDRSLEPPCNDQTYDHRRQRAEQSQPQRRQQARPEIGGIADQVDPSDLVSTADYRHGNENGPTAQQIEYRWCLVAAQLRIGYQTRCATKRGQDAAIRRSYLNKEKARYAGNSADRVQC